MDDTNPRGISAAKLDERIDSALEEYFHHRRAGTEVPDFDQVLQRIEAEVRGSTAVRRRGVSNPLSTAFWRRWLSAPARLAGAGALSLVLLMAWLVITDETAPDIDAALFAQLTQSTLWVSPSDRWLKPAGTPLPGGLPDFSGMQFHMMEGLKWPDLEG